MQKSLILIRIKKLRNKIKKKKKKKKRILKIKFHLSAHEFTEIVGEGKEAGTTVQTVAFCFDNPPWRP